MLEYLPPDVREGLEAARKRDTRRGSRLRVRSGDATFSVLRLWENGLSLDAARAPHLRGLVDIYDGARHICQALIVASSTDNGELICEFKRATNVSNGPALYYWRDENAPTGFLTKQ